MRRGFSVSYDQIGKNEGDNAAETDAAIPEYRSQRNIPDRAYKRDDRHQKCNRPFPVLRAALEFYHAKHVTQQVASKADAA